MGLFTVKDGAVAMHERFSIERHPEIGRRVGHTIAKEAAWTDPDDGERLSLNVDRGSDDRGISGVVALPGIVAEHDRWRSGGSVVVVSKDPA